jgi:hypothetical protein
VLKCVTKWYHQKHIQGAEHLHIGIQSVIVQNNVMVFQIHEGSVMLIEQLVPEAFFEILQGELCTPSEIGKRVRLALEIDV